MSLLSIHDESNISMIRSGSLITTRSTIYEVPYSKTTNDKKRKKLIKYLNKYEKSCNKYRNIVATIENQRKITRKFKNLFGYYDECRKISNEIIKDFTMPELLVILEEPTDYEIKAIMKSTD